MRKGMRKKNLVIVCRLNRVTSQVNPQSELVGNSICVLSVGNSGPVFSICFVYGELEYDSKMPVMKEQNVSNFAISHILFSLICVIMM